MNVQFVIFSFALSVLSFGIFANETKCRSSRDCKVNELCKNDVCQCSKEFVRYMKQCVPIKIHGEECNYDIQCNDHRMICTNEDHDVQQKRFCFCDPYHLWNSTINECLEISNLTVMAGNFREMHKVTDMIEKSAQKVFLGVVIAGLIFVCILLSFIGICSIYGCCQGKKGRYVENDLNNDQINEVAVMGLPSDGMDGMDTNFSDMGVM